MSDLEGQPEPETQRSSRDGQAAVTVYRRLREAILTGELEPGRTASQGELAELLDATRMPLREALRTLSTEGLIHAQPNRRVQIARLSGDDLEQLYIMRLALEGTAIRITVPQLTAQELGRCEGLMATMDHHAEARNWHLFRSEHHAFHRALVSGVGAETTALIGQLFDRAERYRLAYFGSVVGFWEDAGRAEHRRILDCAKEGDADGAAQALALHYRTTAEAVFRALDPDHDWTRLIIAMQVAGVPADAIADESHR